MALKMAKGDLITCGDDGGALKAAAHAWLHCQHLLCLLMLFAFAFADMQKNHYALKAFVDGQSLMLCIHTDHEPVSDWSTCIVELCLRAELVCQGLGHWQRFSARLIIKACLPRVLRMQDSHINPKIWTLAWNKLAI